MGLLRNTPAIIENLKIGKRVKKKVYEELNEY